MATYTICSLVIAILAALSSSFQYAQASSSSKLPVFFFHGISGSEASGANLKANLTAEGHVFNALSFCSGTCSYKSLSFQVPLAIAKIRTIILKSKSTYEDGYIFIGHSQGGVIARGVIENMDEHKVTTFISLAAPQNGVFYGPQLADIVPTRLFKESVPLVLPAATFNVSKYSSKNFRGRVQYDFNQLMVRKPLLNARLSVANLLRSPFVPTWLEVNTFLPVINNINTCTTATCETAKQTRKDNFLKLEAVHYFGSRRDGIIAPYQSALMGQYNEVTNVTRIRTDFETFMIVDMNSTVEFRDDTYGLQTLYNQSKMVLHEVDDVAHSCWVKDTSFADNTHQVCSFAQTFEKHIYPLLR